MRRQLDDYAAVPLGAVRARRQFLCVALFLLVPFILFHQTRLWTGSVSWLGMAESSAKSAPDWMHTPVSANIMRDDFGLSIPMFAARLRDAGFKIEEVIVRARPNGKGARRTIWFAQKR